MTKHSSEDLLICKNISNQTYQRALEILIEWAECAYSVNVYMDEDENCFVPTPIEELEDLDAPREELSEDEFDEFEEANEELEDEVSEELSEDEFDEFDDFEV